MINIIGKTTDDKMVVNGVFRFFETEGIPFDIIFDLLKRNNAIPDWISLYKEAVLSGMKHSRVISMLEGFMKIKARKPRPAFAGFAYGERLVLGDELPFNPVFVH
jgi:hypothetical protein